MPRIAFGDFVGQHGDMIYLEDGNIVTARLGMLWGKEWRDADGFGHVYCEMSLCHALEVERQSFLSEDNRSSLIDVVAVSRPVNFCFGNASAWRARARAGAF